MTLKTGNIWKCDICGKESEWDESWRAYGSLLHEETCVRDMPCSCSEKCREILKQKIESHEFALPKLKVFGPLCYIVQDRKGY